MSCSALCLACERWQAGLGVGVRGMVATLRRFGGLSGRVRLLLFRIVTIL